MNQPLEKTLETIISYLDNQGIVVDYNDLHSHILSTQTQKKKTFKIKPKGKKSSKVNTESKPKSKGKKIKFKTKQNDYQKFVSICNSNNLYYFQFNDEFNWKGPSIKIDLDTFDLSIFGDLEIHILEGYGFAILRPKNHESDKKIVYNDINYEQCKLMDHDILSLNGSDDDCDSVYNADTDYDDEDSVLTEEWTYIPDNVIYQLDTKTNNIYCNQTNQYVGKRVDDFTIDYDTKEHETMKAEYS